MLRGRGGCYKHTFYGIESHRCMETTPSLACANKCGKKKIEIVIQLFLSKILFCIFRHEYKQVKKNRKRNQQPCTCNYKELSSFS